jgi:hypothetical protein
MGFLPVLGGQRSPSSTTTCSSTIAYFSVGADKNGNLLKLDADGTPTTGWGGWTSSKMTSIINARTNPRAPGSC